MYFKSVQTGPNRFKIVLYCPLVPFTLLFLSTAHTNKIFKMATNDWFNFEFRMETLPDDIIERIFGHLVDQEKSFWGSVLLLVKRSIC